MSASARARVVATDLRGQLFGLTRHHGAFNIADVLDVVMAPLRLRSAHGSASFWNISQAVLMIPNDAQLPQWEPPCCPALVPPDGLPPVGLPPVADSPPEGFPPGPLPPIAELPPVPLGI